jgi:hypothetical protein
MNHQSNDTILGPGGRFQYRGTPESFSARSTQRMWYGSLFTTPEIRHNCPPEHDRQFDQRWHSKDKNLGVLQVTSNLKLASLKGSRKYCFRTVMLPYCFARLEDGGFLALNREYKPLGMPRDPFYQYEDFAHLSIPEDTFDLRFASVVVVTEGEVERFWLDSQLIETSLSVWRQCIVRTKFLVGQGDTEYPAGRQLKKLLSIPQQSVTHFGGRIPGVYVIGGDK